MLSVAAVVIVIESTTCGRSLHPVVPVPYALVKDCRWSAVVPLVPTCSPSAQSLALCSATCALSLSSADHKGTCVEFRQASTTSTHVHVFERMPPGGGSVGRLNCRQH